MGLEMKTWTDMGSPSFPRDDMHHKIGEAKRSPCCHIDRNCTDDSLLSRTSLSRSYAISSRRSSDMVEHPNKPLVFSCRGLYLSRRSLLTAEFRHTASGRSRRRE
jgi:hypothetical protein